MSISIISPAISLLPSISLPRALAETLLRVVATAPFLEGGILARFFHEVEVPGAFFSDEEAGPVADR